MTAPSPKSPWYKSWIWTSVSFLGSMGIGLLLLTEVRSGPVVAALGGLGAYFSLAFLVPQAMSGKTRLSKSRASGQSPPDDPRVNLLVEAHHHAATLAAVVPNLPLAVGQIVTDLNRHARLIIEAVSNAPEKLPPVLRFFTYYLPSTADLVMDRIKLAPHAGSARLTEIDQTLGRLVDAFKGFEQAVLSPDLQSVDLDIALLDDALDADFEALKR